MDSNGITTVFFLRRGYSRFIDEKTFLRSFIHGAFLRFFNFLTSWFKKKLGKNGIHIIKQQIKMTLFCYVIRLINGIGRLITYHCGTRIISISQVSSAYSNA